MNYMDSGAFNIIIIVFSLTKFSLTAPPEFKHVDALPEYLKSLQCHESTPDLNECIRKGMQYGIDHLKTGISDVSLPPLDPTEVSKVTYEFANDIISGKVTLRHIEISGFGDTQLKKIDYQTHGGPDISMAMEGNIPQLKIKGNHRADVFLNSAKISSKGSFELILKNLYFKVKFITKLYERNNHKYMRVQKIDFDPTVGDMILKADGLLPEPTLTDYLKSLQCHEYDPQLNDCILKGLQYAIDQFKTGIRDVSLPVLDPVNIKKITTEFSNDLISGKVRFSNVTINGLADIQLKKVNRQAIMNDALRVEAVGFISKLFVKGSHQANVTFSNLKISSNGTFNLVLADVLFNVKFVTKLYERNNHIYMEPYQIDVDPTVGNMTVQANGIFQDTILNDAIVDFINENWPEFYKLLVAGSHESWEPAIIRTANNYFSYIPYDILILKK